MDSKFSDKIIYLIKTAEERRLLIVVYSLHFMDIIITYEHVN